MSLSVASGKAIDDLVAAAFRRSVSSTSSVAQVPEEEEQVEAENDLWGEVYHGDITQQHLEEISRELGLINLCWGNVDLITPTISHDQLPESYKENSNKEQLLLWYAENFRKQYHVCFPKRRPILLACNNECGIQKMVSTTIRPTAIHFKGMKDYMGCASFVADHIRYIPLENPTSFPDQLVSPGEVLLRQAGHCFEIATLLASLLIGASYKAFVVSGYATREVCLNDTSRSEYIYLLPEEPEQKSADSEINSKYQLEPPRDLRSQFLVRQAEKDLEREEATKKSQRRAEEQAITEFEKPPPDPLWSFRRHAWVLILPSQNVTEPCFLEPASGMKKRIDDPEYHGIDSIWNDQNYWVAVGEDRLVSCGNVLFDLSDLSYWEHLLLREPFLLHESRLESHAQPRRISSLHDVTDVTEQEQSTKMAKHLDMPASWVDSIHLPHADFERRYVNSSKKTEYRKCVVELLAPYSDTSGLTTRVTHYLDYERTQVREVREEYANRGDHLYFVSSENGAIHHRFYSGRDDGLKEHLFQAVDRGFPAESDFEFYPKCRKDGLLKLINKSSYIIEDFVDRDDFLYHRHIILEDDEGPDVTVLKINEKYERNPNRPVSEDPASIEYNIKEGKVSIVYHYGENQLSAGTRELHLREMRQAASYDPNPWAPAIRPLALHQLLQLCEQGADKAQNSVRQRLKEINEILIKRAREMAEPELIISPFDEERNQDAKERYKERERKAREEKERDLSLNVDLLAPYLASISRASTETLSTNDARKIYTKCLVGWKSLLLARAVDIQRKFDQLIGDIKDHPWERKSVESNETETERDYRIFKLHCLKIRLMRHKELAPQRYLAIDACLRADPRLRRAFA